MTELRLHGHQVESVFNLLGEKENDITFSLGWALAQSPKFLQRFVERIFPTKQEISLDGLTVSLQNFRKLEGITDIEITGSNLHIIVEAKRGWSLPAQKQ